VVVADSGSLAAVALDSTGARSLLALSPNVVAVIATKAYDGVTPVDMPTILDAVSRHANVSVCVCVTEQQCGVRRRPPLIMGHALHAPRPPPMRRDPSCVQLNFVIFEPSGRPHSMAPGGTIVPAQSFWVKWSRWLGVEFSRKHLERAAPMPEVELTATGEPQ
jgi:hypothetical protein